MFRRAFVGCACPEIGGLKDFVEVLREVRRFLIIRGPSILGSCLFGSAGSGYFGVLICRIVCLAVYCLRGQAWVWCCAPCDFVHDHAYALNLHSDKSSNIMTRGQLETVVDRSQFSL